VDYLAQPVAWRRTGAPAFTHAARVNGAWWVLRRNGFPDHPLYTLFVNGTVVGDVQDLPTHAPAWDLDTAARPWLTADERDEVLTVLRGLGPYGAEVGEACDGDWCGCPDLTDAYIRETVQPR
jgi:hypothetical protein